jgi:transcriptional regulator with XRE-family HTH domain
VLTRQASDLNSREVLAVNMRRLRVQQGLTQETLAFEAGLHRTFVAHVERGARNISLDNLDRIALALGVSPGELITTPAIVDRQGTVASLRR